MAKWIGLSSKRDAPAAWTSAVLVFKDPVAIDFHSTKYCLSINRAFWDHQEEKNKGCILGRSKFSPQDNKL